MESRETSIGPDIDAPFDSALDADAAERELAALTYASARAAAAQRSPAVEALLAELDRLNLQRSARVNLPRARRAVTDADADVADAIAPDEIDAMSDELLMRQACYRAAIDAIVEPVTPSLAAFLA